MIVAVYVNQSQTSRDIGTQGCRTCARGTKYINSVGDMTGSLNRRSDPYRASATLVNMAQCSHSRACQSCQVSLSPTAAARVIRTLLVTAPMSSFSPMRHGGCQGVARNNSTRRPQSYCVGLALLETAQSSVAMVKKLPDSFSRKAPHTCLTEPRSEW